MKHPWEYNYKQGDIVDFDLNGQLTGIGEVVGAASANMPVVGATYILRVIETTGSMKFPNETYPFDTIVCPEVMMTCKL